MVHQFIVYGEKMHARCSGRICKINFASLVRVFFLIKKVQKCLWHVYQWIKFIIITISVIVWYRGHNIVILWLFTSDIQVIYKWYKTLIYFHGPFHTPIYCWVFKLLSFQKKKKRQRQGVRVLRQQISAFCKGSEYQ